VQSRFEPLNSPPVAAAGPVCAAVSITTSVALRFDNGKIVRLFSDTFDQPVVAGAASAAGSAVATVAELASALPAGVALEATENAYKFILDDGTSMLVRGPGSLSLQIFVPDSVPATVAQAYTGLLLAAQSDASGDYVFTNRDGTSLP